MHLKKKRFPRIMSLLLACATLIGMLPLTALAAPASDIPATMLDNLPLEGLAYTGYDIQWMKDSGTLYQPYGYAGYVPEERRSNIGYSGNLFGTCTVADPSTPTGLAPDLNKFRNYGLDCTAFGAYYYFNFLRNVKGKNVDDLWGCFRYDANNRPSPTGIYTARTVYNWYAGAEAAVAAGLGYKVGTSINDLVNAAPGDLIIFQSTSSSELVHIGVYIGYYNRTHFMAHVGNSRGPEIQSVNAMADDPGSKASRPYGIYHFDSASYYEKGFIAINKTDTNGSKLAGAKFIAENTATGVKTAIGPTDANGYAISEKEMDLGTYIVTETTFPEGYGPYGPTSWTVTLAEDTPGGTVTINAVNQENGTLYISKDVDTGKAEDKVGWQFQAVDNATGQVYGPYTTVDDHGITASLPVGTYTVTEINTGRVGWVYDTTAHQVEITSGGSAYVEFLNKAGNTVVIQKNTNTGGSKPGFAFMAHQTYAYDPSGIGGGDCDYTYGPFVTDENGKVTFGIEPGTYEIYEVNGGDPYWTYNSTKYTVQAHEVGATYSFEFENWQYGKVQVTKETNTPPKELVIAKCASAVTISW